MCIIHTYREKKENWKEIHQYFNSGISGWWFEGAFYFLLCTLLGFPNFLKRHNYCIFLIWNNVLLFLRYLQGYTEQRAVCDHVLFISHSLTLQLT